MPKVRAVVKKKNRYYIPKHRFYELYHYCMQYGDWLAEYNSLGQLNAVRMDEQAAGAAGDPTFTRAARRLELREKMDEIKRAAAAADRQLAKYILLAVTKEGASYQFLRNIHGMPCGRNVFYDRRRKFYWIMDRKKNGKK